VLSKTETTLTFEGLEVLIRYCAWSVWGGSFIEGLVLVKRRLGGNILNEDMCKNN
jgi:hypothetical protein